MNWLAQTRPGYEKEFCREFRGTSLKAKNGSGWALVEFAGEEPRKPWRTLFPSQFTFARQIFLVIGEVEAESGRLASEVASLLLRWRKEERQATGFHTLFMEAPDTNEGKALLDGAEGFEAELREYLSRFGLIGRAGRALPRLHIFILSPEHVIVGLSDPVTGSRWPMGAPKFELPPEAPSRSARKLEEAIEIFVPPGERDKRLRAGMRAVDLGASPGGWTWQLSRRGLLVQAVDNGNLAPVVFDFELVEHIKSDGYSWKPKRSVHWLTCDIVGGALRIARLVSNWVERSLFREAIFNLKLGDGDRTRQVETAKKMILEAAKQAGVYIEIKTKHLYHDRDEVTAHVRVVGKEKEVEEERGPRVVKEKDGTGGRRGGRSKAAKEEGAPSRDKPARSGRAKPDAAKKGAAGAKRASGGAKKGPGAAKKPAGGRRSAPKSDGGRPKAGAPKGGAGKGGKGGASAGRGKPAGRGGAGKGGATGAGGRKPAGRGGQKSPKRGGAPKG